MGLFAEAPACGEVQLAIVPVGEVAPPLLARLRSVLDVDERARADRIRPLADRTLFIVAHALLRVALSPHLPALLRFRRDHWGRPEIDSARPAPRFSLTHTRGLVACALSAKGDVGVDAEAQDAPIDVDAVAEYAFAADDLAQLRAVPLERHRAAFFQLWTTNEAYIKALGRGLTLPFPSRAGPDTQWRFRPVPLPWPHCLTVALHGPECGDMTLNLRVLTADDLRRLIDEGSRVGSS